MIILSAEKTLRVNGEQKNMNSYKVFELFNIASLWMQER
jgi:hypothetical protein